MAHTFDSLHEGDRLPTMQRACSFHEVLRFLGAAWLWGLHFYDDADARSAGLPGPVVPGAMKQAIMERYLLDWLGGPEGGPGRLARLQLAYRRPDPHDSLMTFGGEVTRKYAEHGRNLVDLELWIDNPQGERSTRAGATIAF